MGFEPTINQRLLPPTFPRFIKIQSFESTYDYLNQLFNKLNELLKVSKMKTFSEIYEFSLSYSTVQSVFLRSMLQVIIKPILIRDFDR